MVLEYRQLAKLKSNYVDSLPLLADSEGRVHTTFNQVGTATGRLSSTNPNLQNIPIRTELGREIRAAFIAAPGRVLLSADYSQIELRLMAHFSEDPLLRAGISDRAGHSHADGVGGVRRSCRDDEQGDAQSREGGELRHRVRHFAVWAGGAAGHRPAVEARLYIETYFERYAGVRRTSTACWRRRGASRRCGRCSAGCGRFRISRAAMPNQRGFAERTAVNTPLQGTAADLIKMAMIRIDKQAARSRS